MSLSNCVSIVNRMDQRDQDAVLAYLDFHLKAGMKPEVAQRLAVQDAIKGLARDSVDGQSSVLSADGKFNAWPQYNQWSRAEYNDIVSLLPAEYRSDPHRQKPISTEDRDALYARALPDLDYINEAAGENAFQLDSLGNIVGDVRRTDSSVFASEVAAVADKHGLGVFLTGLRTSSMEPLSKMGFVPEMGLGGVLARVTKSNQPVKPMASGTINNTAYGTMMGRNTRGFPAPMFSERVSPLGFYSALAKGIDDMPTKSAPAASWATQIKGLVNKGVVKTDELEWSGLTEWLDLQEGKVPKEQIAEYLQGNGVKVEEVTLEAGLPGTKIDEMLDAWAERNEGDTAQAIRYGEPWGDIRAIAIREGNTDVPKILDKHKDNQDTKYGNYTLPGGKNYREVLLTLPEKGATVTRYAQLKGISESEAIADRTGFKTWKAENKGVDYQSAHWDQKNVLAHLRLDDRVDSDGRSVLMVQEIQSDWGQDGKKKGFADASKKPKVEQRDGKWGVATGDQFVNVPSEASAQALAAQMSRDGVGSPVPTAPFVTKTDGWLTLALKRVMILAAEGGYSKVAFVNGDQSAERYDLSKQVDELIWFPDGKGRGDLQAFKGRDELIFKKDISPDDLPDLIGKESADRLMNKPTEKTPGRNGENHTLSGVDLKVGGAGMIAFYDKIVPNAVKALLKKVGSGQMESVVGMIADKAKWSITPPTQTVSGRWMLKSSDYNSKGLQFDTEAEAQAELAVRQDKLIQPGFSVTPAMREKAAGGMPMFSKRVIQEEQNDDKNGNFYTDLRQRLGSGGSGNYPGPLLDAALLGLERPGVHSRQAVERHDSGRGDGAIIVRWTDATSLKDYYTTGLKGRTQKGESGFYMPIVPAQYVGGNPKNQDLLNAIVNGQAATVVEVHNLPDGSIELAIRGPRPGGQFHRENAVLTKPTGLIDPDGVEHLQVPVGPSAAKSFIREALRRYAMLHGGALPDLAMARSTGANPSLKEKAKPGAEMEARYSIRAGTSAWDEPVPSRFDDLDYKLRDKMVDVRRVVESIGKTVGKVADDINVYLQEELFHGRAAKRTKDFAQQELQPLMESMAKDGLTIGDVEEYLHARHANEANTLIAGRESSMPDGGSGMTNAAAATYLANIPANQQQKLQDAARQVDAILAKTRQMYADYGLESQQTVDGWAQMFQHYVPLQREDKEGSMGIGQGFSVKGKEVKGRTGSTRKVVDILANVAMQRERLVVRGEKNRVAQALLGLAAANPNADFWTVGSPPKERVYDPKTNTVIERVDPMYKSRDNVLVAKVRQASGAVVEMAVNFNEEDPRALRMAQSLKNLDAGKLEGLLGVSAVITRYFAAINTQYNPVFGVVNLIRDVQGAMINLSGTPLAGKQATVARDTMSALAGIYSDIRAERKGKPANSQWAQLFEEFQKEGGQTGFRDLFRTSADRAKELQYTLTPHGWMESKWGRFFTANGVLKVPMAELQKGGGTIFGWLSDYNDAMENGVRLATYKSGLDAGMSKQQAASLAKNITVNFNRRGQIGQQAGAVYAFFNAAMQGTARMGQLLFDMDGSDPKTIRLSKAGKKIVYGGMLVGVTNALALAAAGFDDEDPPEFVRERSLVIPIGDKKYISIPMPLGLHVLPGLGRHATEFALSGFEKPAHRAVSLIGMFADSFNPIGNAGLSMQTLAPTALDPLVALTENKDWTGKPIARTSSNRAIPGYTQWKDTAPAYAKVLAEGINWVSGGNEYVAGVLSPTPDQIDYLVSQVTGGVGRELSKVEQTAKAMVQGEDLPTFKIPLLGRFIGNSASQASQSGAFYSNVNKLNELETEVKGLRKDGRGAEAAALMRSRPDAYLQQQANVAERQIQRLRREKRELIKADAPREAVKAKEVQITAVMMRLNLAMEKLGQ